MANTIGWGKGTQNNSNGWGKFQNTIGAASVYAVSYAGETSLEAGAAYDTDAQAFFDSTGITDTTQKDAVNTLVTTLKTDNLWSNMVGLYPFVGGTASTHKYNLKNPQDTNAAFRLTFSGGWTHSATGATPNGTNAIADTHIVLNNVISSVNEMSYGYYSRDTSDVSSGSYEMGSYQGGAISAMLIKFGGSLYYQINGGGYNVVSNPNTDGFFVVNRSGASAVQAYRNGSSYHTGTRSAGNLSTLNFGIGGLIGIGAYGSKESAFAFIYNGSLDESDNSNLYNAVQAFNTSLSRQV